jgi:TolA-binding protein
MLLTLSSCSLPIFENRSEEPTLADIPSSPLKVTKSTLAPSKSNEVIENYRALLRLNPDHRLHSEATRRLADLQLQKSEIELIDSGKAPTSEKELLKSIHLYEELLEKDPDYGANDRVRYQLARAYELKGDIPAMMKVLRTLVTNHPQSDFWAEARFRQGERYFILQDYQHAQEAYSAILTKGDKTPYYDRALFKHGWSHFKQRRVKQGLDSFTRLLDRNLSGDPASFKQEKLSPGDQALLKETLRVISLTFSELGGTSQIRQYFDNYGHRSYEYLIYQGLGELYLKQERIQDAADAYLAFVNLNPAHHQSPHLSVQVVDMYAKHNFPAQAVESKKAFTQHYAPSGAVWKRLDPQSQAWLNEQLRAYLKELAEYHHALAQHNRNSKSQKISKKQIQHGREAALWYRRYLDLFPKDPKAGGISFLLGELLFELNKYPEAVVAYEDSAYRFTEHKQRAEAGYAALLAYAEAQKGWKKQQKAKTWRKQGIESALRFCDIFPKDPRRAQVLTEAANQLFEMNDLGRARGAALQVTHLQPPAEASLQQIAWIIAAHASFEQQDFVAAEKAYQQALVLTAKKEQQQRLKLEERLAASIYQQGVERRTQGDHRGAAGQFLRISTLAPASSILATAQYDAAASLIAAGNWAASIPILENYKKHHPKNDLISDVARKLAAAYMETGQSLKAAKQLRIIATLPAALELRQEASWKSAELFEKEGKTNQAIKGYKYYVYQFPQPLNLSLEAKQKLVMLYEKSGESSKGDWWRREIIKTDALAGKQRTERSRFLAATASMHLAQSTYSAYRKVKLKAPLKKNLKLKKKRMQTAIKTYKQAAEYGVAEITTEAIHQMGEIYQLFGAALMASERPKGLNTEELEQYEILLEEQAYPFEEKAIMLFESNTGRASQGIYDMWVKKSFAQLAKLIPGRYAKQEKWEVWADALR